MKGREEQQVNQTVQMEVLVYLGDKPLSKKEVLVYLGEHPLAKKEVLVYLGEHPLSQKESLLSWWRTNAAHLAVYSGYIQAIRASVFCRRKCCIKAHVDMLTFLHFTFPLKQQ